MGEARADGQRTRGAGGPIQVQLFYRMLPNLRGLSLQQRLRARLGNLEDLSSDDGPAELRVVHPEFQALVGDRNVPLMTMLAEPAPDERLALPPQPEDRELEQVLAGCRGHLLVVEYPHRRWPAVQRLAGLQRVVDAMVSLTRPEVLHWTNSGRWTRPGDAPTLDLGGFLRTRVDTGAEVVDTVGMTSLGLPDVQIPLAPGQDPEGAMAVAREAAAYLVARARNHPCTGFRDRSGRDWTVREGRAVQPPGRDVVVVEPA